MFKGLNSATVISMARKTHCRELTDFTVSFNADYIATANTVDECSAMDKPLNLTEDQWVIYDNVFDESITDNTFNAVFKLLQSEESFSYDFENRKELAPAKFLVENYLSEMTVDKLTQLICASDLAESISKELPKGEFTLWSKSTPSWHNGRKRLFTLAVNNEQQSKIDKLYKLLRANLTALQNVEHVLNFELHETKFSTVFEYKNFKIYITDRYTDDARKHLKQKTTQSAMQLAFDNAK